MEFTWTLTTNETFGFEAPPEDYFEQSGIQTVLIIYDSAGSLTRKRKFVLEPGVETVTYQPGDILSDFGGAPASFYVRLWSRKAGRKSFSFEEGVVTKVGVAVVVPGIAAPLAMWRVLEVPRDLAKGAATPMVTALAVRAVPETTRYRLYDSPDNAIYERVTTRRKFAFGGTVAADYPAETDHVDLSIGLLVNLVGPDITLPAQDELLASNNKLMVFVGDEIITVQAITVVSPTQVRLFGKRGKFDTGQLGHAAGEAVFIIPKRSIRLAPQDTFADDDSAFYKVQAATDELDGNLAAVASQSLAIAGRALLPQPFKNLLVNGAPALSSPTYAAGSDIAFSWTLTTNELFGNETLDVDYFAQSGIATILNIYDSAGSLVQKRHLRLDPGVSSYTYADADLVADFGGRPHDFYVRVFAKKAGRKSFSFEQATITKA